MTRRQAIRAGLMSGAALGGLALGGLPGCAAPAAPVGGAGATVAGRTRVLRLAHITDTHVQPERGAAEGLAMCLRRVQAVTPRVDMVITGGDLIMDGFAADEARTRTQWDILTKVFRDECGLPVRHTLGNHDIWGWNKTKSRTTGGEPRWGKAWALEQLGMPRAYHAHRSAGWKILHLDSIRPDGDGYAARLDDEQLAWLDAELAATARTTHVLVVSHVPILSFSALFDSKKDAPLRLNSALMHADARALHERFVAHGGVRLCVSGHIHQQDEGAVHGVAYRCNGAACGNWWKPGGDRSEPGFTVIDLYNDGSFDNVYTPYGWTMRTA
ncbi:MAG: metallophosphoesterase [Phycisphaerae bacterium]|nr:metallophosphoesterase [Phycisphaerae bacterium]